MKNKNIFKINIIYFVALTLVATIFVLGYAGILTNDILSSFLIQIVVMFSIPLLMYSLINRKNIKETFKDCGLKKISKNMIFLSIALGFVLYLINTFVADAFYSIIAMFGYESISTTKTVTFSYGTLLKEFVLSCIFPGFCEEFLHRGIMLHAGKKHTNSKFCLIISSLLFGLTHLNIGQFFYAAILGFLMGYVSLVADSIIPAIIIHFMNNFLSTYFYYGTHLNWPLAQFVNFVTNILLNNVLFFIGSTAVCVFLLILLYKYLVKLMQKERAQRDIRTIINAIEMQKLSLIEAQIKINEVNAILKNKTKTSQEEKKSPSFSSSIFLISSIILGSLVTISSFIWGII